ncbi:DUF1109 family protein [Fulvimarina endophytica]|uniref:DUF1109 family protein n=1 Tax=Fulvimarina endophytica TaxID=2293836 RepID=A0A371X0X9_9HYPH|nr:NrsF family protein [Fulvimarina endophytica]RFC62881.1 DUF1109 family protein [Fulvimarina endophytica]
MRTEDLIARLSADGARNPAISVTSWRWMAAGAAMAAGLALFATLGIRPDFMSALGSVWFVFKFVLSALVAVFALSAVRDLASPTGSGRGMLRLAAPAVLLVLAVAFELSATPSDRWVSLLSFSNGATCMVVVPLLGLVPLGLFLYASYERAPVRPALQGALCGLAAAGFASFFYAARCTNDSPLFVATWYSLAALVLVALGAVAGSKLLRW